MSNRPGEDSVPLTAPFGDSLPMPSPAPDARELNSAVSRETSGGEVDGFGEFYRDEVDAPAALLTRMRVAAQERGEAPLNAFSARKIMREFGAAMSGTAPKKRRERAQGWDPRVMGGYSGPGESSRDPKPLGGIVSALIRSRGWKEPVAVSSVLARWAELVGPEIAAHTKPLSFENSIVQVQCDSTAWATQLRLMHGQLIELFRRELGEGVVAQVRILGPNNGRWIQRGYRRPSGMRGVRDTYG